MTPDLAEAHVIRHAESLPNLGGGRHAAIARPRAQPFVVGVLDDEQTPRRNKRSEGVVVEGQDVDIVRKLVGKFHAKPYVLLDDLGSALDSLSVGVFRVSVAVVAQSPAGGAP